MRAGPYIVVLVLATLIPLGAAEEKPNAPAKSGLVERVTVEQIQIPIRIWPTRGEPEDCQTLTKADFELWIDGTKVTDFELSFDPSPRAAIRGDSAAAPGRPARHIVLWFDEPKLSGPPEGNAETSRSRAFTQAAELLAQLEESVTVTIVDAFDNIELFETASAPVAATKLETLRARYRVPQMRHQHVTEKYWWRGLEDGVRRLGMHPGHKELYYLTADVALDVNNAERQRHLSAVIAQSDVSIYPIRLVWEMRGLAYGLLPLAEAGGGHMFANKTDIVTAVATTERMSACQGVLITRKPQTKKKSFSVHAVLHRKGFTLTAPMAMEGTTPKDVGDDDLRALLGIDHLQQGLEITPSITTIRPLDDGGWESELTFHVKATRPFEPAELGPLRIYGAVWKQFSHGSKVYQDINDRRVPLQDVAEVIRTGKEFRFGDPVRLPPGTVQVIVAAFSSEDKKVVGSRQIQVIIPRANSDSKKSRR